jgi:hypothetical protein
MYWRGLGLVAAHCGLFDCDKFAWTVPLPTFFLLAVDLHNLTIICAVVKYFSDGRNVRAKRIGAKFKRRVGSCVAQLTNELRCILGIALAEMPGQN